MKEKPIQRILKQLAEQAVPSDLDLWPAISAQLKARPTPQFNASVKGETLMNAPVLKQWRFRVLALFVLVVLLMAATFATPWGKAFAQSLFQFFAVAEGDSFPLPTEEITLYNVAPTVAPTFAAQLKPIETEEPTTPIPTIFTAPVIAGCEDALASLTYRCQVSKVEEAVGFDAKEPSDDIPGLVFERAEANPTLGVLGLHYKAIGGGTELIITQSRTDLVALGWGEVPPSANVEKVKIGQYDGEYVQGTFIVRPGATSAVWEPNAPVQRLRWREGDRLFGIDMLGRTASVEYLGKEALAALAESLVYAPNTAEGQLRAEYLTNVQDAEALAGVDLQEPTILPEGFAFKYADYDTQTRRIRMVYEFGSQSGVAGLIIFQTPIMAAIDINLADGRTPGTVEQVAIGTTTGHYVPREGGAPQALVWRTNDLQIEMYFFPSQWYGGRLEKADMVAIAESMK